MAQKIREYKVNFDAPRSSDAWLRMGIEGGPGAGKTWTSLALAQAMGSEEGDPRVAVIDSDGGAVKFRNYFNFHVYRLYDNHPDHYVSALRAAEAAGFKVAVIDSGSLAWSGAGGAKELVDLYKHGNNDFSGWKEVSPIFKRFLDTIDDVQMHVIVTLRLKTEWVMEKDHRGKMVPVNVGLEADFGKEGHYKFDVVMRMDAHNDGHVWKSRFPDIQNKRFPKPTNELGTTLLKWLRENPADDPFDREAFSTRLTEAASITLEQCADFCASLGKPMPSRMGDAQREKLLTFLGTPAGAQRLAHFLNGQSPNSTEASHNQHQMGLLKAI